MPVVSIASQKGGSCKTTTAINLAAGLKQQGKNVLLIDADPQASLSISLGIKADHGRNLYTEFVLQMSSQENGDIDQAIQETRAGLPIVPSSIELALGDMQLVSEYESEYMLQKMIRKMQNVYDYIFIDCPPSAGMLTINALVASDYILMPLQAEFLPLKSISSFMHHFESAKKLNERLEVLGFVLTRYDHRMIMNRNILHTIENEFGDKLFQTRIRNNIQLAKAQEAGTDIFNYDKNSHGAEDYNSLSQEFLLKIKK